jgi:hypothetical protein
MLYLDSDRWFLTGKEGGEASRNLEKFVTTD